MEFWKEHYRGEVPLSVISSDLCHLDQGGTLYLHDITGEVNHHPLIKVMFLYCKVTVFLFPHSL